MRKKYVTHWILAGKRCPAKTPGASKEKVFVGWVQKLNGKEILLGRLKETAKTALAEKLQAHQLQKHGVVPAIVNHRAKLAELFDRYGDYQRGKATGESHVSMSRTRLDRVATFNGWTRLDQVTGQGVEDFLADARKRDEKHKKDRFGRTTQNLHRATWKAFGKWLERTAQVANSPMRGLEIHRTEMDVRLKRRPYTPDEVAALLQHVPHLGRRSKMEGPHRAALYAVAVATGFRLAECAALRPESLVWLDGLPFLELPPEATKNKRGAFQPVPATLAEVLRPVMDATPPGQFLFPIQGKTDRTEMARTIRKDLAEVRKRLNNPAPGFLETVKGSAHLDFHAFRSTFASTLATSVTAPTLGKLARHGSVTTTQRHYVTIGQKALHGAVEGAIGGLVCFSPVSPKGRKTVKSGETDMAKIRVAVQAIKDAGNPLEIRELVRFLRETLGPELTQGQGVEKAL